LDIFRLKTRRIKFGGIETIATVDLCQHGLESVQLKGSQLITGHGFGNLVEVWHGRLPLPEGNYVNLKREKRAVRVLSHYRSTFSISTIISEEVRPEIF
jgi:hypothetical protein